MNPNGRESVYYLAGILVGFFAGLSLGYLIWVV